MIVPGVVTLLASAYVDNQAREVRAISAMVLHSSRKARALQLHCFFSSLRRPPDGMRQVLNATVKAVMILAGFGEEDAVCLRCGVSRAVDGFCGVRQWRMRLIILEEFLMKKSMVCMGEVDARAGSCLRLQANYGDFIFWHAGWVGCPGGGWAGLFKVAS